MIWEVVIGLETHAQLSTASKIFSGGPASMTLPWSMNTTVSEADRANPIS